MTRIEPLSSGSAAAPGGKTAGAAAARMGAFYDRHPYPPPLTDLSAYSAGWDDARRRADAHLFWPDQAYRDDRHILVAGCGTSQAVKYALRWPKAQVTGIDVSKASLDSSARLADVHAVRNLTLHELPVERASELGREFDHIVCTGVLHHLPDPDAGLAALRSLLGRGGALHLMLYAPYGRAGIYLLQDYCRRVGVGDSPAEIHDLAAALASIPPGHPLAPLLRSAPDFQDEAGIADALLHPQDRSYSVPQLMEFLNRAGLGFRRWVRQAPYLPTCGVMNRSPHQAKLIQLPLQEQFAALELFRGTMVEHSLVACRDGHGGAAISFDGDAWLHYVPIRRPRSIVVQERLPQGAAAVLINQEHTFTDLYLPIDPEQKALFDAIDGRRSIASIASDERRRTTARVLFERLWWYDQVVFDASAVSARP